MISREGFDNSSSWHIFNHKIGTLSLSWVRQENKKISARRLQYFDTADKSYTSKSAEIDEGIAYETILNSIGRHFEERADLLLGDQDVDMPHLVIGTLPAGLNPNHMNFGQGKKVSGYLIIERGNRDTITFITAPDYDDHAARKAHITTIQKISGKWMETEAPEEHLEIGQKANTPWVAKAFRHKASLINRYQPSM